MYDDPKKKKRLPKKPNPDKVLMMPPRTIKVEQAPPVSKETEALWAEEAKQREASQRERQKPKSQNAPVLKETVRRFRVK